jgi:hypothetical protein
MCRHTKQTNHWGLDSYLVPMVLPMNREIWHHQEVPQRASSHQYCHILVKQWKLETIVWVFPSLPSSLEAHKFPNFMSMSTNCQQCSRGNPFHSPPALKDWSPQGQKIQFQICQDPRDHWRTPLFSKIIEGQTLYIPQRHSLDLSY